MYKRQDIRGWSSEALANAGDYNKALAKMDSMKRKTAAVKQAYQQVAYNKAVLDYNDGKFRSAVDNLMKSVRYPLDKELESKAYFWMAEAYAYGYKYQDAAIYYQRVSSQYNVYTKALYGLGYAQYNQQEYTKALSTFTKYLERPIESGERKLDALVRLADCYYVSKNYDKAITLYSGAIRANAENLDYIYYQKALAELAGGRRNQASQTLDYIMTNFPESKNLDRAYFEKAQLYFEINDMSTAVEWLSLIHI